MANEITDILRRGENLQKIGINYWALTKKNAINLLKLLEKNNKVVLGGDVYVRTKNEVKLTHDSWFFDKEIEKNDFYQRSILFAKDFKNNYKSNINGEKLFVIIFE